jgi:hypothetical protein
LDGKDFHWVIAATIASFVMRPSHTSIPFMIEANPK